MYLHPQGVLSVQLDKDSVVMLLPTLRRARLLMKKAASRIGLESRSNVHGRMPAQMKSLCVVQQYAAFVNTSFTLARLISSTPTSMTVKVMNTARVSALELRPCWGQRRISAFSVRVRYIVRNKTLLRGERSMRSLTADRNQPASINKLSHHAVSAGRRSAALAVNLLTDYNARV